MDREHAPHHLERCQTRINCMKDMQKLDDMYEELLWHPDDELQFTHDGEKIIITNKTLEEKQ
jgi:hypothetical protein